MKNYFFKAIVTACFTCMFLLVSSCKNKNEHYDIGYEYEYFPLDSGHFIIYDVDSIRYSAQKIGSGGGYIQKNDTAKYQLMEYYAGKYFDSVQGIIKYRIEYYQRKTKDQAWRQDRVWWATTTTTNIQRQEDDLKFIKLIFPPRENATWNGTIFIPKTGQYEFLENWNFKMTEVGTPKEIGPFKFNKTLVVTHIDTDDGNLINNQLSREIYAKGVGIVYKEWDKIDKQDVLSGWDNPQNADGFRIRMKVFDYFPK